MERIYKPEQVTSPILKQIMAAFLEEHGRNQQVVQQCITAPWEWKKSIDITRDAKQEVGARVCSQLTGDSSHRVIDNGVNVGLCTYRCPCHVLDCGPALEALRKFKKKAHRRKI